MERDARSAWRVTSHVWVAEGPGRPEGGSEGLEQGEHALRVWGLSPDQAPQMVVIVDRRVPRSDLPDTAWPAQVSERPVPAVGNGVEPIHRLRLLVLRLIAASRDRRVLVVGGAAHTTLVALALLMEETGTFGEAQAIYAERAVAPLSAEWARFLHDYSLQYGVAAELKRRV
ncbi:hypothetical protein [Streptomyces sp. SID3343]|uniref:hypothetical protein n=1 Tax=Streptomyces sp. SID3343 TaxID=2690260 RepID=UPI0013680E68|nr:hypothetical protein [Streptomyces sp. SID3343]MYW03119.1 hypothetical protein [Streptomyces sp. SID3343]